MGKPLSEALMADPNETPKIHQRRMSQNDSYLPIACQHILILAKFLGYQFLKQGLKFDLQQNQVSTDGAGYSH